MKWIDTFIEYLFPPHCAGCRVQGFELCEKCIEHIRNSFPRTTPQIHIGFSYQDPIVKRVLKALKFRKRKMLAKILGELLYERIIEDISDEKAFSLHKKVSVVPIPLSKKRLNERGFNQSELVARSFASRDSTLSLSTNILFRHGHTKPQSSIHLKRERLENIKGVFGVKNKELLKGATILLIDDIVTTGATMKEALSILKKSGAKKVILIAVAH
ncbi:MAG: ComF family protein [Candidatus Pacebacteria bacterium]|nr:ComF family protein [Candidatus Paceibacterota bacterium]MBP9780631.1 ComF family protein [Candidatus Paceibacterota bacterium]